MIQGPRDPKTQGTQAGTWNQLNTPQAVLLSYGGVGGRVLGVVVCCPPKSAAAGLAWAGKTPPEHDLHAWARTDSL